MSQDRLNGLIVLPIEKDTVKKLDFEDFISSVATIAYKCKNINVEMIEFEVFYWRFIYGYYTFQFFIGVHSP